MRILSALLLGASSLLASSYVAAQEAPVGNVKILDALRSTRADIFSRVNLDRDLVVVGELDSIDYCELKYAGVRPGPFVPHARVRIRPCRWIVGHSIDNPVLYYTSIVYFHESNGITQSEIAGGPWLVPNEKMLLMASPSGAVFENGGGAQQVHFIRGIRYLAEDCMDDDQPIYEYSGSSFEPQKALGTTEMDLAGCVVVRRKLTDRNLGHLIEEVMNNGDQRREKP